MQSVHLKAGEAGVIDRNTVRLASPEKIAADARFIRTMPRPSRSNAIFQDDANRPAYFFGWQSGDWDGDGWRLSGDRRFFVRDETHTMAQRPALISIHSNGKCWGMLSSTSAVRDLGCDLPVGGAFSIDVDFGNTTTGRSMGFALCNSEEQSRFEFISEPGGSTYMLRDGSSAVVKGDGALEDTGVKKTDRGLQMLVNRTGVDTYQLRIMQWSDRQSSSLTRRFIERSGGTEIRRLLVWNDCPGKPLETAFFFNRIRVISPPGDGTVIQKKP